MSCGAIVNKTPHSVLHTDLIQPPLIREDGNVPVISCAWLYVSSSWRMLGTVAEDEPDIATIREGNLEGRCFWS